ncbi:macrophage mannose receptor 1 [Trichonephila clavipes]|nr:macrophage mannose receptor 1 [Trichonephila clavipes]
MSWCLVLREDNSKVVLTGNIIASSDYWIGLSAKGLGSSYTWSDGTPLDFLYWKDESDLNQTERVNTCVTFNQLRGFWTTAHCNRLTGVICKRGVNSSYVFPTQEPTPVLPGNCEQGWYLLGLYKTLIAVNWINHYSLGIVWWEESLRRLFDPGAHGGEKRKFLVFGNGSVELFWTEGK